MRKMKNINGYLVVRFNERERRDYPALGLYGVISAEDYTGYLDIDLQSFEYDDAELLEVAVEQARGLESESEAKEPEARPLPRRREALLAYVCDELCRHRIPGRSQEELDGICATCPLERLADAADGEERRTRAGALETLDGFIETVSSSPHPDLRRRLTWKALGYLQALADTQTLTEAEAARLSGAIDGARRRAAPSMDQTEPPGHAVSAGGITPWDKTEARRLHQLNKNNKPFPH